MHKVTGFHVYLGAELDRRRARNASYSMRAFANALDIDHSTLSQMIRGKRALTSETAMQFGRALKLPAAVVDALLHVEGDPLAILDLVDRPDFRADSRWIAAQLGIGIDQVNASLAQLIRAGLLEMQSPVTWRKTWEVR